MSSGHSTKQRASAIEIFLVTHVVNFIEFADAVEIEVVDGTISPFATSCRIFVDEGKGGGGDDVFNAQLFAYGFDKRGLARSHVGKESEDAMLANGLDKGLCCLVNLFETSYLDFHVYLFLYTVPVFQSAFFISFLVFPEGVFYFLLGVSVMSGISISSIEMPPCWNVSL